MPGYGYLQVLLRAGWARVTRHTIAALAVVAGSIWGAAPSAWAAPTQRPVDTRPMADPGIYLYQHTFNAFTTGGFGLWRSTAPRAAGPWTARVNVLDRSSVPSWIKRSDGIWAPDVVRLPDGGWVVYFAAMLNVNPSLHVSEKAAPNGIASARRRRGRSRARSRSWLTRWSAWRATTRAMT